MEQRSASCLPCARLADESFDVTFVEAGPIESDEGIAERPPAAIEGNQDGREPDAVARCKLRLGDRMAVDRADRPSAGDVDLAQQVLRRRAAALFGQAGSKVVLRVLPDSRGSQAC